MADLLGDFIHFMNRSPTVWHASKEISTRLAEKDFIPLYESDRWQLEKGKQYFFQRDDALLCAFRLPKKKPKRSIILASHLDSPSLKIKPKPELSCRDIDQLGTEVYGAPLLHTWLDRDLGLAGRLVALDWNHECHTHLVFLDDYPLIIPGVAIHLDRSIMEKGINIHKQDQLKPIFSLKQRGDRGFLEQLIRKHVSFEKLISFDLFLVPLDKANFLGLESEFIASYRLDNLTSAYASLHAMTESEPANAIQMAIFWDHEEIGSRTSLGADSLFVNEVLERIAAHYEMDREDYYRLKSRSFCISADLTHGFHPSYADKYDPENAPEVGKGVCIKFNAGQKYATSAATAAPIFRLGEKYKIPIQTFASRSDIPSGSTVGSMMAASTGIPTVDLGISGWAMHSIREVIAADDEISLCNLLQSSLSDEECFSIRDDHG